MVALAAVLLQGPIVLQTLAALVHLDKVTLAVMQVLITVGLMAVAAAVAQAQSVALILE